MSFRQDRTNPSTAVSNWHGRSETPKGWPSTRVSTWLNGGLFSAAGGGIAYEAIGTHTFDGTTATYSFTSIPQTYADLRVIFHSAVDGSNVRQAYVRVNGASDSYYANAYFYQYSGNNDSHTTGASQTLMGMSGVSFFSHSPQNEIWDFIDYANTTAQPHYQSLIGQTAQNATVGWNWVGAAQGDYANGTPAITSIEFYSTGGNYPNGSTVTLFGIGAAY